MSDIMNRFQKETDDLQAADLEQKRETHSNVQLFNNLRRRIPKMIDFTVSRKTEPSIGKFLYNSVIKQASYFYDEKN